MNYWNGFRGIATFLVIGVLISCANAPQPEMAASEVAQSETAAASGQQIYAAYCASCHGLEGKGDGPAAAALRTPPTDLTILAAGNNGEFPEQRVYLAAKGENVPSAHGSKDMPVWGPAFLARESASDVEREQRLLLLVQHIKSLQSSARAATDVPAFRSLMRHPLTLRR
jgi:mono/diheme cytochrome c family protein